MTIMRKSTRRKSVLSVRVPKEMKDELEAMDGVGTYVTMLIAKDLETKDSLFARLVKLEQAIEHIKKIGQILNSGKAYFDLQRKCVNVRQRTTLQNKFIAVLDAQKTVIEDNDLLELIEEKKKEIRKGDFANE